MILLVVVLETPVASAVRSRIWVGFSLFLARDSCSKYCRIRNIISACDWSYPLFYIHTAVILLVGVTEFETLEPDETQLDSEKKPKLSDLLNCVAWKDRFFRGYLLRVLQNCISPCSHKKSTQLVLLEFEGFVFLLLHARIASTRAFFGIHVQL